MRVYSSVLSVTQPAAPEAVVTAWSMLGREVHNALQVKGVQIALKDDHGLRTLAERGGKGPRIVLGRLHQQEVQVDAQRAGGA